MTPLQIQAQIRADITGLPVGASTKGLGNVVKKAKQLQKYIEGLKPGHAEQGIGRFRQDLLADTLERGMKSAKTTTHADMIFEGSKRAAEAITPANAYDLVPLDKVFTSAGMTGKANPSAPMQAVLEYARRAGINPNDVGKFGVPKDVARDMVRLGRAWENPDAIKPVIAAWDAMTNLFKTGVTAAFPSFHARNLVSNLFNMWRSGDGPMGDLNPDAMREAFKFVRGDMAAVTHLPGMNPAEPAAPQLIRELIGQGVAFVPRQSQAADVVGASGATVVRRPNLPRASGKSLAGDALDAVKAAIPRSLEQANPLNVSGVGKADDVFAPVKAGRAVGGQIEDWSRTAHYMAARKRGLAPAEAAAEVKKYQLDYNELTDFERNVMKRLVPWYSFSRRNLPPILSDLVEKPAKLTAAVRVTTGGRTEGEFIPPFVAEGASIPIPGAPAGGQRYISSLGLPFEDEAIKTIANIARGDVIRGAQGLLGMTSPYIKGPMEATFGTQLYSGRELHTLKPSETVSLGGLVPEVPARVATQLLANTPLARTVTFSDKLLDPRKGAVPTALNTLTGARITDVDAEQQQLLANKRLLAELLKGNPGVKEQRGVYLQKDRLESGTIDPETLLLYRLYLDTERKITEGRKAK